METWPVILQDYLNENAFSYQPGDVTLQSENSIGPKKRRRRVTSSVDVVTCTITIDKSDFQLFKDFYYTTLAGGVKSFAFNDPITGDPSEYKIEPGWTIGPVGGRNFSISMTWEKQL